MYIAHFLRRSLLLWGSCGVGQLAVAGSLPPACPDSGFVRQSHRRLVVQVDQRFSPLNGKLVGINGVKVGLEWRGRLRAGLGGYFLSGGVPARQAMPDWLPTGTQDELQFRYLVAYGEYVLIGTPRWELSTPTQFGFGTVFASYRLPDGDRAKSPLDHIWLVEPSVVGHMRIFRWVGLGAGAGYRQMLFLNSNEERELSGVILIGRVKLFLGDLYKVVRGRERLFSQQGL